MELQERIRSKGLKQKWVAEQIGVNPNTLNAYLVGLRDMPQKVSDDIKKLLKD